MADPIRAAVVENGIVVNVELIEPGYTREGVTFVPSDTAGIGWKRTKTGFEPPAPAPPEPAALGPISDRQFFQALALPPYSVITPQEALDAVKTGEIPAVMQAVIDTLPEDQQFAATMILAGGTQYEREHPLVNAFGASRGMDTAAIDAFWRFAQTQ